VRIVYTEAVPRGPAGHAWDASPTRLAHKRGDDRGRRCPVRIVVTEAADGLVLPLSSYALLLAAALR
jgi:hypothetical protein